MKKEPRKYILLLGVSFILVGLIVYHTSIKLINLQPGSFELIFLNVGQGDSILIKTKNNSSILIDGGRGFKVINELQKILKTQKKIDLVIATHMDADHIGGLVNVLNKYDVETVIFNNSKKTNKTIERLRQTAKKNSRINIIDSPKQILVDGVEINVLYQGDSIKNENDKSIITYIRNQDAEVLLTGDASKSTEEKIIKSYASIFSEVDVLKVGHHGSKTSTSENFLDFIKPEYAVISAGAHNSYGHPDSSVVDLLKKKNIEILETKNGTILFTSINGGDFELRN